MQNINIPGEEVLGNMFWGFLYFKTIQHQRYIYFLISDKIMILHIS